MYSTIVIGTTIIFFAYYIMKRKRSENLSNEKNKRQNESNVAKYASEPYSGRINKENLVKLLGMQANYPRSTHNSIVQDLYLPPIDTSKKWEIVGKVDRLYIYPIEGGGKRRLNQMVCSNISSYESSYSDVVRDRCFIVYSVSPSSNIKTAVVEDPRLRVITVTQSDNIIFVDSPDIDSRIELDRNKILPVGKTEVNYGDGTVINVQDCGDEVSTFLTTVIKNPSEKTPRILRLGIYTCQPRGLKHHIKGQSLTGKKLEDHLVEALSPTYSACTIVNEASVNFLRNEIGKLDLTHDYFRPHIVIKGKLPKYAEDEINVIRIGKVVLTNKLPCIQNINVNVNPSTGNFTLEEEPYRTLLKTRPLANTYSKYNSNEPIFGINMKVLDEGEINEGDNVYVQWDNKSLIE